MNKITGKQEVVGGFDLNSFVEDVDPEPPTPTRPKIERAKPVKKPVKPVSNPTSERVQVMLTKNEHDAIVAKAGLVPVSKWLRHELKEKGII